MRAGTLAGWSLVALGALLVLVGGSGHFDGRHLLVAAGLWMVWRNAGTETAEHENHDGRTEAWETRSMREAA